MIAVQEIMSARHTHNGEPDQRTRHTHNGFIVDEVFVGTSSSPEQLSSAHFCCIIFHAARFIVLTTMTLHTTTLSTLVMQSCELVNTVLAFGFTVVIIYYCYKHPRKIKAEKFDEDDYLLNAVVVGPYLSKIYYFMVGLVFAGSDNR